MLWGSIGYIVSLVYGHYVVKWFHERTLEPLKHLEQEGYETLQEFGPPPWLTGLLERLFFTTAVALNISGVVVAMVGWITIKMYSGHLHGSRTSLTNSGMKKAITIWALLNGVVSMLFALIGGAIVRLPWTDHDKVFLGLIQILNL